MNTSLRTREQRHRTIIMITAHVPSRLITSNRHIHTALLLLQQESPGYRT